ncbi:O-antigen ligase family protein [Sulfurovum sp.]|uniref:O-antigen ligase family protein n=1 Tax=Sulfurovum sp. TaxID=1969726 RepID=UPI002632F390|nr:O-antigen ligase family protein [Sulfurovum sp.]
MNDHRSIRLKKYFVFGSKFYSDSLNMVFVLYAFLLPFSKAFPLFTAPYVILFLWLMEGGLSQKTAKLKSAKVICFLLLFFMFTVLSLLWTNDIYEGIQSLKYYFAITVVIIVFFTSVQKHFLKPILYAFLFSMFISEMISYGIYFEWWSINGKTSANPTPFMHHTIYSVFLVVTIFLLLIQLKDKSIPFKLKVFEFLFLLSSSTNLFINGGRTGQLALIFGTVSFVVIYYKKKMYLLYAAVFLTVLFFSAYRVSPNFHQRADQALTDVVKIQEGNLQNSWGWRIMMKIVSYHIIEEHPLIGVGVGDVLDEYRHTLKREELKKYDATKILQHLHDQFLQVTVETGFTGLAFFLLFLFYVFRSALNIRDPLIRAALFSILVIFIFSFFTDVPLKNFTGGLFAFIVGYLLNYTASEKTAWPTEKMRQ